MNKCSAFRNGCNSYAYANENEDCLEMAASYSENNSSISITHFKSIDENGFLLHSSHKTYLLMEFDGEHRKINKEGIKFLKSIIDNREIIYYPGFYETFFRFIATVLFKENHYSFEKIMCKDEDGQNQLPYHLFQRGDTKNIYSLINFIQLDGNVLEKLLKSFGESFILKNIISSEISFDTESNKLNQALSIPKEVMKRVGKDLQTSLSSFQTICNVGDGNDAIYLLNFIDTIYAAYPDSKKEMLIKSVSKILEQRKTSMPTLLTYLFRQQYYNTYISQRSFLSIEGICDAAKTLLDTLIMHQKIMHCKMESLPGDLYYEHMVLIDNLKAMEENPELEKRFICAVNNYSNLNYTTRDFIMRAPKDSNELIVEGTTLRHCVASYRERIADEGCIVMFCRKKESPEIPFVTIEFDYDLGITQIKTFCDKDVLDENVLKFAHKWEEEVKKREKVQCT